MIDCYEACAAHHLCCRSLPLYEEILAFISTAILALLARVLPDTTTLSLAAWHVDDTAAEIMLRVTSTPTSVSCPLCYVQTPRVHSRYTRTLTDLPWGAYAVDLQLCVRKFFPIPPDLVVHSQPIDIIRVLLRWIVQPNVAWKREIKR